MEFNNSFFEDLGRSAGVTKLVMDAAEKIAAIARETAPVKSGAYRRGITVELKHQDRSVALVVGHDPKTMLIESKKGVLARALRAAKKYG